MMSSHVHGKNWTFGFEDGKWLSGHLGMTGALRSAEKDFMPSKHDHLILIAEETALIFSDPRMFGRIRLDKTGSANLLPQWWRKLPPQILSAGFTKKLVSEFAAKHGGTPIKTLLLDQRCFPGIGNWMADEICWRMETAPGVLSGNLEQAEISELWRSTRRVARQALQVIGRNWGNPPDSWLFPHRWKTGGRCPRKSCHGAEFRREKIRGRTTCWCPVCQAGGE